MGQLDDGAEPAESGRVQTSKTPLLASRRQSNVRYHYPLGGGVESGQVSDPKSSLIIDLYLNLWRIKGMFQSEVRPEKGQVAVTTLPMQHTGHSVIQ